MPWLRGHAEGGCSGGMWHHVLLAPFSSCQAAGDMPPPPCPIPLPAHMPVTAASCLIRTKVREAQSTDTHRVRRCLWWVWVPGISAQSCCKPFVLWAEQCQQVAPQVYNHLVTLEWPRWLLGNQPRSKQGSQVSHSVSAAGSHGDSFRGLRSPALPWIPFPNLQFLM